MAAATAMRFAPISVKIDHSAERSKAILITRRVLVYAVLIILCVLCILPFYMLLINCTRTHSQIQQGFSGWFGTNIADNWNELMKDKTMPIVQAFWNSLLISTLTTVICVYFSCLTAYAFHQYEFPGKKVLFTFVLLIMMIPTQISSAGFVKILNQFHQLNKYWPLIVPSICSPVTVFFMKQYLDSVMPNEIVEAARVDGAGEIRIFHQVALPILKPAIAVQSIFCFVGTWNNFFIPALLITDKNKKTIPLIIALFEDSSNPSFFNLGKVYLMMTFAIFPLLIIYLLLSKFIIKGVTLGSVKG
jgi:multiple sugar transport system permease protein